MSDNTSSSGREGARGAPARESCGTGPLAGLFFTPRESAATSASSQEAVREATKAVTSAFQWAEESRRDAGRS